MMRSGIRSDLAVIVTALSLTHCGGTDENPGNDEYGTGGVFGSGGVAATGGAFATGGFATGTGGLGAASGGAPAGTGGFTATGGATASGGAASTGGMNGTGGAPDAPDAALSDAALDGDAGTGGAIGSGGAEGTGGAIGSGGAEGTGGAIGSGGAEGSGGSEGSGGATTEDAGAPDASVEDAGGPDASAPDDASVGADSSVDGGVADSGPDAITVDAGDGALPNTLPGFVNLAPPMLAPLDPDGDTALNPPPPTGWKWYPFPETQCRDGSQAGLFVRFTQSDKLFIYLEGGGACTNLGFCNFNPANVNRAISGDGQTVIGSALGVVDARQQPGVFELGQVRGIFDTTNAQNPFRDWNGVYIPYCTGDVFFGTKPNATVPGVAAPQQFVGYSNMRQFIGRLVPTFRDSVDQVVLTGASAGSFGAALNYSMVQDAFGEVPVDALLDSGVPFSNDYMPVCMQKRWRETWGLNAALPPDCTECFDADGGGLLNLSDFLIAKHPNARLAAVSSTEDEVIRLFFSMGIDATGAPTCADFDTVDPVALTVLQVVNPLVFFSASQYTAGLADLRARYFDTGRFATYYLGGANARFHQHTWRARFYDPAAGSETIAAFVSRFLGGQLDTIGP